jgi:hypothetical protein
MIAISHAVKLLKYAADAPSFENFCVRHCPVESTATSLTKNFTPYHTFSEGLNKLDIYAARNFIRNESR